MVAICFAGWAQVPTVSDITSVPLHGSGHDYIGNLTETVNPANGSLSLRIAVPTPKGRGISLPFFFAYDSNITYPTNSGSPGQVVWRDTDNYLMEGGWTYTVPMLSLSTHNDYWSQYGTTYNCEYTSDYMFQDSTGDRWPLFLSIHAFEGGYPADSCQQTSPLRTDYLYGGWGPIKGWTTSVPTGAMFGVRPVIVADASGTVYTFQSPAFDGGLNGYSASLPSIIEDRNGNEITSSDAGNGQFSFTDTMGRTLISSSGFGTSGNTVTVPGMGSPYTLTWGPVSWNYTATGTAVGTGSCNFNSTVSGSSTAVTAISLPNGKSYQFQYDSTYGRLQKVTYPSGAWVQYTWGMTTTDMDQGWYSDGYGGTEACRYPIPVVTQRQVSYDGTNVALTQDFTYGAPVWGTLSSGAPGWTNKATYVTDYDNVRGLSKLTTYNYVPGGGDYYQPNDPTMPSEGNPVESSIVYGNWGSGTLRTVQKTWSDPRLLTSRTVTLDNNKMAETAWTYNSDFQPTEEDEYEYGSGAVGPLIRKTITTYASFSGNVPYLDASPRYANDPTVPIHIDNLPSQVTVENASGGWLKATGFIYDSVTPGPATAYNHDDTYYPTSFTTRGDLTQKSEWLGTSGSTGGGRWVTTTYTWDNAGQVLTMADPLNHTWHYSWADNFPAGGQPGNTDAYITQITDPAGLVDSFSWNYAGGQINSHTGPNGHTTSYSYETGSGSLGRLTGITYPDSSTASYLYNDTPNDLSTEIQRKDSGGTVLTDQLIAFDNYGHTESDSVATTSGNWKRVDTCYDGEGKIRLRTLPWMSTSSGGQNCSQPGDTFTYDGLGRATEVTHSDGSHAFTSYQGAATEVQDEGNGTNSIIRILQHDALGRLTGVCEVSPSLTYGPNAAQSDCGLDIDGTSLYGFLTSYSWDPLGDLLGVTQTGLTTQRSFVYDTMQRLTSATNPETGATLYAWNDDGTLATRTDARQIVTTYTTDADHRVTQKQYSDGTPTAKYLYDVTPSGWAMVNVAGRLSREETDNASGTPITEQAISYDSMGRISTEWQCTPQNCGSGWYALTYGYDPAGRMTSWSNGAGVTFSAGYDMASRLTSLTSSLNDSQHPGTLLSSVNYNAFGEASAQLGANGFTEYRGYDSRGRLQQISEGGALNTSGAAGTGSVTITGTENSTQGYCVYDFGHYICNTTWNTGTVSITVNGVTDSTNFGQYDTDSTVASNLAAAINADGNASVTAAASGSVVTLTAKSIGINTDYTLSTSSVETNTQYFTYPAFTASASASASGSALTGGSDPGDPSGLYWSDATYAADGDVTKAEDSVNGGWNYGYDDFNRLTSANCGACPPNLSTGMTWDYDRFGNRWQANGGGQQAASPLTFNGGNNRIDGYSYDASGDLLAIGSQTYTWDAEQRLTAVGGGSSSATYLYDAEGRRVQRTVNGTTVNYAYDLAGHVVAEFNSSGGWSRGEVYAGGRHLATYADSTTYFDFADYLGTGRAVMTLGNTLYRTCSSDPWGSSQSCSGGSPTDPTPNFLTDKPRDPETGFDDFGARYNASSYGRWVTPDWSAKVEPVPYAKLDNPQSLNLYSYVLNNPATGVDADGHDGGLLDFLAGVFRGAECSVSCTSDLRPSSSDSSASLAGQAVGTLGAGLTGAAASAAGTTEAVVTTPAAATGVGAVVPAIGAVTAAAGAVLVHGATENAAQISQATSQRDGGGRGATDHAQERADQARAGDAHRDVGEQERTIRDGRAFRDAETGHTVHVRGSRVVVVNENGDLVTQFKNSRNNTNSRIQSGRWIPIDNQ